MRVLFVCVGNSCRSQMAEAIARHHGIDAASAGTRPAPSVSRNAIAVMEEAGIETGGLESKMIDLDALGGYDRTVTMGCGVAESCPSLHTDEDWDLDDPVGQGIDVFRQTLRDIQRRVAALKETGTGRLADDA